MRDKNFDPPSWTLYTSFHLYKNVVKANNLHRYLLQILLQFCCKRWRVGEVSLKCRWGVGRLLLVCRLSVGEVSVRCRPSVVSLSASVGEVTVKWRWDVGKVSVVCCSSLTVKCRWGVMKCWPTDGQQSADTDNRQIKQDVHVKLQMVEK